MRNVTRIWLLLFIVEYALPADPKLPAQVARGQALFFDESNARRCGSCHLLAKQGAAVGPDLTRFARLSPRAIVTAIRATRTAYVQQMKLKNGSEFPGMPTGNHSGTVQYYDLTVTPPALRKLDPKEIASTSDNNLWKHPPESGGYTVEQLADIIAFIKWASYGNTQGVNPADIE